MTADLRVHRSADVDRFGMAGFVGSGFGAIAGNRTHGAINVSRDSHDLVHSVVNQLAAALGSQRRRAHQPEPGCECNPCV